MRKSNSYTLLFSLFTVALTMVGCNRNAIYDHYELTSLNGRDRTDTLYFSVTPVKESGLYSEEIALRANAEYPFTELTVVVRQKVMPEERTEVDTVTFHITDKEGNSLGKGFNLIDHQLPLNELLLNKGDSVSINVTHYMRRENLPGIMGVGIALTLHAPTGINAKEDEKQESEAPK